MAGFGGGYSVQGGDDQGVKTQGYNTFNTGGVGIGASLPWRTNGGIELSPNIVALLVSLAALGVALFLLRKG
jgi:hypothetical protein